MWDTDTSTFFVGCQVVNADNVLFKLDGYTELLWAAPRIFPYKHPFRSDHLYRCRHESAPQRKTDDTNRLHFVQKGADSGCKQTHGLSPTERNHHRFAGVRVTLSRARQYSTFDR